MSDRNKVWEKYGKNRENFIYIQIDADYLDSLNMTKEWNETNGVDSDIPTVRWTTENRGAFDLCMILMKKTQNILTGGSLFIVHKDRKFDAFFDKGALEAFDKKLAELLPLTSIKAPFSNSSLKNQNPLSIIFSKNSFTLSNITTSGVYSVELYSLSGKKLATVFSGVIKKGVTKRVNFNKKSDTYGLTICKIITPNGTVTKKIRY